MITKMQINLEIEKANIVVNSSFLLCAPIIMDTELLNNILKRHKGRRVSKVHVSKKKNHVFPS